MIITQNYPLWATVKLRNEALGFEPVIAWRVEEGERPVPIGARQGELSLADLAGYLTTETEYLDARRNEESTRRRRSDPFGPGRSRT